MITTTKGDTFTISHLWGVDHDEKAIQTYNANGLGEGVIADALDFVNGTSKNGEKTINDFPKIDALAFGFPCNDFSLVGEQKGLQGKYGNLYKAGIIAINHSNPKWFIAENVSGIHSANSGQAFKKILNELSNSGKYGGYNLTVNLYKFEEYGVPQYRHRYIIVGIRNDLNLTFKVPTPICDADNYFTAEMALQNIPDINNEKPSQTKTVQERLLFTLPGKNAWHLDKLLEMDNKSRRIELSTVDWYDDKIFILSDEEIKQRIEKSRLNCKKGRMSHIYKRLTKNKPSYTITGSGGGGTHVYHWEECRALTNRERARLQSFPDDFLFVGTKEQVRKQIGMAVPPIGSKIIFQSILKMLAGIPYDHVEESHPFTEELF